MLKYHIQTIEVGAAGAASIAFTSIPQIYDDLLIVCSLRQNTRNSPNGGFAFQVIPNNSTTGISARNLRGDGSVSVSQTLTDLRIIGGSSSDTANTFGNSMVYIPNYARNTAKTFSMDGVNENNATDSYPHIVAGLWNNTAAITSLRLEGLFGDALVQYSSASLYGIRRGSDGRTEVASGGTITTSGGYTIHTFNSSGTFVANRDMDVEYVVVAGGGGGGANGNSQPGGGGAGGYRSSVVGESSGGGASAEPKLKLNAGTSYSVVVGAGGAGGISTGGLPSNGSNSVLANVVSLGGGYGGTVFSGGWSAPTSGGSGGGGGPSGASIQNGGAGTANQGYAGGTANDNNGSGGGGAGEAGNTDALGAGGDGVASSITGSSVTRAGGGATRSAAAGDGGGGAPNNAGVANTGGGGGAGVSTSNGFAGGSGVVIIRYLTPA